MGVTCLYEIQHNTANDLKCMLLPIAKVDRLGGIQWNTYPIPGVDSSVKHLTTSLVLILECEYMFPWYSNNTVLWHKRNVFPIKVVTDRE
jgi:hypothetical protein